VKRWFAAPLALGLTALSVTKADSIWDRQDPRYGFLFQDNRARRVGDTLIVTISENTVANDSDSRALSRTTSGSGSVTFFAPQVTPATTGTATGTGGTAGSAQFQLPTTATAQNFSGSATTATNHVFTDTMAVTVVDMKPNGNLVVEGYRTRVVEGEERVLRITGIVRQADIAVGNTIPSGSVANFRITYLGRGPATNVTKPGWLTRLYNAIRPI
jgi:flagellar L-ring protein precursor FlgH